MNTKLVILLGSVGAVHLVAGGLFLAGGCAMEDPPMPPGIYVPQQDPAPAQPQQVSTTQDPITELPAVPAEKDQQFQPEKTDPKAKEVKDAKDAKDSGHGDRLYVVVKNDSLWKLARKNGLTVEELASYNNLPANAKLKVGQKIYIPAAGKKAVQGKAAPKKSGNGKKAVKSDRKSAAKTASKGKKPAAKSAPKAKNLPPDGIYVVKAGDNFSTIAKHHGLRVSDIMAANPGVDSSRLKIGQQLRLTSDAAPVKSSSGKAAKTAAEPKAQAEAPADGTNFDQPAPAKEVKQSETDDLLNSVKEPKNEASEAAPNNEAVNAVMSDPNDPMSTVPDKDKVVTSQEGKTMEATVGEATTLDAFCRKYHVSESEIRKLNPDIPADGQIKARTRIKLPGADETI